MSSTSRSPWEAIQCDLPTSNGVAVARASVPLRPHTARKSMSRPRNGVHKVWENIRKDLVEIKPTAVISIDDDDDEEEAAAPVKKENSSPTDLPVTNHRQPSPVYSPEITAVTIEDDSCSGDSPEDSGLCNIKTAKLVETIKNHKIRGTFKKENKSENEPSLLSLNKIEGKLGDDPENGSAEDTGKVHETPLKEDQEQQEDVTTTSKLDLEVATESGDKTVVETVLNEMVEETPEAAIPQQKEVTSNLEPPSHEDPITTPVVRDMFEVHEADTTGLIMDCETIEEDSAKTDAVTQEDKVEEEDKEKTNDVVIEEEDRPEINMVVEEDKEKTDVVIEEDRPEIHMVAEEAREETCEVVEEEAVKKTSEVLEEEAAKKTSEEVVVVEKELPGDKSYPEEEANSQPEISEAAMEVEGPSSTAAEVEPTVDKRPSSCEDEQPAKRARIDSGESARQDDVTAVVEALVEDTVTKTDVATAASPCPGVVPVEASTAASPCPEVIPVETTTAASPCPEVIPVEALVEDTVTKTDIAINATAAIPCPEVNPVETTTANPEPSSLSQTIPPMGSKLLSLLHSPPLSCNSPESTDIAHSLPAAADNDATILEIDEEDEGSKDSPSVFIDGNSIKMDFEEEKEEPKEEDKILPAIKTVTKKSLEALAQEKLTTIVNQHPIVLSLYKRCQLLEKALTKNKMLVQSLHRQLQESSKKLPHKPAVRTVGVNVHINQIPTRTVGITVSLAPLTRPTMTATPAQDPVRSLPATTALTTCSTTTTSPRLALPSSLLFNKPAILSGSRPGTVAKLPSGVIDLTEEEGSAKFVPVPVATNSASAPSLSTATTPTTTSSSMVSMPLMTSLPSIVQLIPTSGNEPIRPQSILPRPSGGSPNTQRLTTLLVPHGSQSTILLRMNTPTSNSVNVPTTTNMTMVSGLYNTTILKGNSLPRVAYGQPRHPAPLPRSPIYTENPGFKLPPPKPKLSLSKVNNGIVLSWGMRLTSLHETIQTYELYAYQESGQAPSTSLWKKVGDVRALPLPMACTLTQFVEGNKYHFAVRGRDSLGRFGSFSDPSHIFLSPP